MLTFEIPSCLNVLQVFGITFRPGGFDLNILISDSRQKLFLRSGMCFDNPLPGLYCGSESGVSYAVRTPVTALRFDSSVNSSIPVSDPTGQCMTWRDIQWSPTNPTGCGSGSGTAYYCSNIGGGDFSMQLTSTSISIVRFPAVQPYTVMSPDKCFNSSIPTTFVGSANFSAASLET